jgi:hypothetical protein
MDSNGSYTVDLQRRCRLAPEVDEMLTERHLATHLVEVSRNSLDGLTLLLTAEQAPGWLVKPLSSCVSADLRMEHCGAGNGMEFEYVLSVVTPYLSSIVTGVRIACCFMGNPFASSLEDRSQI